MSTHRDSTRTDEARARSIEHRRARCYKHGATTTTRNGHTRTQQTAPAWR